MTTEEYGGMLRGNCVILALCAVVAEVRDQRPLAALAAQIVTTALALGVPVLWLYVVRRWLP